MKKVYCGVFRNVFRVTVLLYFKFIFSYSAIQPQVCNKLSVLDCSVYTVVDGFGVFAAEEVSVELRTTGSCQAITEPVRAAY